LAGGTRGFADGQGITAQFDNPADVAAGPDFSIYVADSANHRIRKISAAGQVSTLAGSSNPGHQDGTGSAALLSSPTGIAVNVSSVIVFADSVATDPHPMFVRLVSAEGKVTALAGSSSAGSQDGQGTQAFFRTPANVAIDKDGNVYVADTSTTASAKLLPTATLPPSPARRAATWSLATTMARLLKPSLNRQPVSLWMVQAISTWRIRATTASA
jgi:glucose/arabinose dehydrogenase